MLERVLLGEHPVTGDVMVGARGSAGRVVGDRHGDVEVAEAGPAGELLTADQAAKLIGVDTSYVRRVAGQTENVRQAIAEAHQSDEDPPGVGRSFLDGARGSGGEWEFQRAEVERFIGSRVEPQVVLGYDLTYSVPKSVSVVWAAADDAGKAVIEDALHEAVDRALGYMENNAIHVGRGQGSQPGGNMVAASFLHDTNRELEPQLHVHVVVANMAAGRDGTVRALDGRGMFGHATTSGHLAETEIQSILNQRGYSFTETENGISHVVGVPQATVDAFSTRRAQIMAEVGAVGTDSPASRQLAALATRAAKDTSIDAAELHQAWNERLVATGFGPNELLQVQQHRAPMLWTPNDTGRMVRHLSSPQGVTSQSGVFDRRDVVCTIADGCGGRLNATEVEAFADQWLTTSAAIPLETVSTLAAHRDARDRRLAVVPGVSYYTTPEVIATEQAILAAYQRGHNQHAAVVPAGTVDGVLTQWEQRSGFALGDDQAQMVRSILGSGDRFQAVIGPAGSGKTTALEVAARSWEASGHRVIGVAVNGTAAEVLGQSTGIESTTVASLLARLDHTSSGDVVDGRTVVLVDEASTLGNRAHAALINHVEQAGAVMRTIGDPAQHGAVEAGGMWAHLTETFPTRTPELTVNRRQTTEAMDDVRLAAADYRDGKIAEALERLTGNERMVSEPTSAELLDSLASDWFCDWENHLGDPGSKPSHMVAESHVARRDLNTRAQTLLKASGHLTSPGVTIGESTFHIGDHVVARAQNRSLTPLDGTKGFVRNGNTGVVTDTGSPTNQRLIVDFADKGPIEVPYEWLEAKIRTGVVGGLAPSYALTTHAAQGQTFDTSRSLLTDRSSTEGQYVALTRGQSNVRFYAVDATDFTEPPPPVEHNIPVVTDTRPLPTRIATQLTRPSNTELATVADTKIAVVLELFQQPLAELDTLPSPEAARARELIAARLTATTIADPPAPLHALIGDRPTTGTSRWEDAAGAYAIYHHRYGHTPKPGRLAHITPDAPPQQHADYQHLRTVVIDARANLHNQLTAPQLKAIRTDLVDALASADRPMDFRTATGRVDHLEHQLETLQRRATRNEDRLEKASKPRAVRKDRDGPERARRQLSQTQHELRATTAQLADARALAGTPTGINHERISIEIAVVDTVINNHATTAIANPQPYLDNALGPRPANPEKWDRAATAIETHRIGKLGLNPQHGPTTPTANDPLEQAIGVRPHGPQSRDWDRTARTVSAATNSLHPSVPTQTMTRSR